MSANQSPATQSLTSTQRRLIIGVLIAALVGLGYWWFTTLKWEEQEIDLGYSKEAKQNDYLAAELFLRKQGVRALSVKNMSLLDQHSWRGTKLGAQDTIVLIKGYKTLTWERYSAVYDWVENGGTLITSTHNPFVGAHTTEEDILLQDFNITPEPDIVAPDARDLLQKLNDEFEKQEEKSSTTDESGQTQEFKNASETEKKKEVNAADKSDKKAEKPENYYRCNLNESPTPIKFASEDKPLNFDFSKHGAFIYSNDAPDDEDAEPEENQAANIAATETSNRKHLLYFEVGDGSISITSDNSIWSNQRIDCHDHAYALWRLINPNGRVWFLVNQDAPSLASILWRNAQYGLIAAIAALILWLWAMSLRFGPVLTLEQSGRRSLAEHIFASAMLLWRKNEHPQLLDVMRKEILKRMDEQHPNLIKSTQEECAVFLHELTGVAVADIQTALFASALRNPQEFANAIAHLQIIRNYLHGSNL